MSGADDTFVVPRVLVAFLNASGHFSIVLPATNDPDWVPVGWTFRVTLDFGDDGRQFLGDLLIPYDAPGGTVSLAALAPVPAANGQLYALYNDPRFSGTGGGGGGVTSVFGRTGVVVKQAGDYAKGDVGLGSVDNTSDVAKPVSTAQAAADALVASNASSALTAGLAGKAASVHTHAESDVTSLVGDLSTLTTAVAGKAATVHTHVEADVTALVSDLAGKQPLDSDLTTIAGLTATTGSVIQSVASAWAAVTPSALKTSLSLTKADVGLANVDNTADTAKPVSTAQQTALDGKQPLDADLTAIAALTATTGNVIQSVASAWSSVTPATLKGTLGLVKADVGLGNVDNTADTAKPVSTAQQTALNLKADLASPTFTGTVSGITKAMVGLGSVSNALQLVAANNLSDLVTPATARTNLGLGGAAVLAVGTTTGTVAAGDDSRITGAAQKASNLSDLASAATARTNLGLGGAALLAVGTTAGTVAAGDDSRIVGALQKSVVTAKGDLYVATASGVLTNLAVGADTQVLTADSTQASGVKWGAAGGAGTYSLPDGIDPPSGDTHICPPGNVATALTTVAGTGFFVPVPMGPNTRTLNSISVDITGASGASGVLRAVLWSSTTGRKPNLSLIDFGTVIATGTGVLSWTALTQSMLANTLYYIAIIPQVAGAGSLRCTQHNNPYVTIHTNMPVASTGWAAYAMSGLAGAVTNGTAFVYLDVDPAPRIGLKFA
jgi:hypothetical protein